MSTTTKRKELNYENPDGKKKSKSRAHSNWPNDVSNTYQRSNNSNKKVKYQSQLNLLHLPDEIILIILTYLNKASIIAFEQTCQRYRAISSHPTLWRRIDISYKYIDSEQLNSLLQRGTETLKMYQTTIEKCHSISFQTSALRHLDLTSAIISSDLLTNLLQSCHLLRKLSLDSLPLNYQIIEKIVENEQLDTLNLSMCTGLTFDCCQLLISKLTLLRCLNLAWTNLSIESLQFLCETIPRCIEQLNLSGQRYNLTDDYMQSLVRRALRLRILDISDSLLITDQSIISIRQHLRLLTHLSVSRCYLLTPTALISLKLLPAFSSLDIFGTLAQIHFQQIRDDFQEKIQLNISPFSNIARPTTGIQRTSIWGLRTRL